MMDEKQLPPVITTEQRIERLTQATIALHESVREFLRQGPGPRSPLDDHEQRMEERRQSDYTCLRIELIRAATALLNGPRYTVDEKVQKAAQDFLIAEFGGMLPPKIVHRTTTKTEWDKVSNRSNPTEPDVASEEEKQETKGG